MSSRIERYVEQVHAGELAKPNRCAVCAHGGGLIWHGIYLRSLITLTRTWIIPIKRLYCRLCDHTFALLPSFVVKFHRYARSAIAWALRALRRRTFEAVAEVFMQGCGRDVAPLTFYFWRRKFA